MVKEHLLLREYSGKPWSHGSHARDYLEKLPVASTEENFKETATRYLLPRKNIFTFGLQNGITERIVYYSCKMCRAFVKPHDVKHHMITRHSKQDSNSINISQTTNTHTQPSGSKSKKNSHKSKKKIVPPPSVPPPPLFPKIDLPPPPPVSTTSSSEDLLPPVLQPVETVEIKTSSSHKSLDKLHDTVTTTVPVITTSATSSTITSTNATVLTTASTTTITVTPTTTTSTSSHSSSSSKSAKTKKPSTPVTPSKTREKSSSSSSSSLTKERSSTRERSSSTRERSSSVREKSSSTRERSSRSERTSRSEKSSSTSSKSEKSSKSERDRSRRKRSKRSRNSNDYNPDKHCGVLDSYKRPCMRALTCANHTIIERRAVSGRSKNIDKLIQDYKASRVKNNKPHMQLPITIAPKQCTTLKEVRNGLRVIELIYGNDNSNSLGGSDFKCSDDPIMTSVLENLATITHHIPRTIKPSTFFLTPTSELEQVTRVTKLPPGTIFKVSVSQSSPPNSGSKTAEVPSQTPTLYSAHPKPMTVLTAPLRRVGSSFVLQQQAQRLDRQRLDLQAVVNQHKQLKVASPNKQVSLLNSNHNKQSILKSNVKNNVKSNPLKRSAVVDKNNVNDIKHMKVIATDMNGFILNTDFSDSNETQPATTVQEKVTLLK